MKLSIQEKNNLYFSILKIIDSVSEKKQQAKEISIFIEKWLTGSEDKSFDDSCIEMENLPNIQYVLNDKNKTNKKGIFRRV